MDAISDLQEANRCVRELTALSLLPALWSGGQSEQIRESLADILQSSLRADLVSVFCRDLEGRPTEPALRMRGVPRSVEFEKKLADTISIGLGKGGSDSTTIAMGERQLSLVIIPLGPSQEFGAIAVGSCRREFPTASDRILLDVAVNQAIIAFRSARQVSDNARLYHGAQREIAERIRVEDALREAQRKLHQHAEDLENEVAQRTFQLKETIQELEAFSYSVSHDMRSPLRAMQGYADALLEDYGTQLDKTAQGYLERIRRTASRMDLLIQDVLAYSRVAKGEIDLRPLSIEGVISEVTQNYPALQPARVNIKVAPTMPKVLAHEAYLTQIISNFLTNAVKFVPPGKVPEINIFPEIKENMARINFRDNGIGIDPEHHKQIFQIFGRVYSEKKFEGTGIGLAIAKKAAERMGGSVGVDSQLGCGSTFFVLLKRAP